MIIAQRTVHKLTLVMANVTSDMRLKLQRLRLQRTRVAPVTRIATELACRTEPENVIQTLVVPDTD